MDKISIRDHRKKGGQVVERELRGEQFIITRDGCDVAELHPVAREPLDAKTLLTRWSAVPRIDAKAMREEVDDLLDPSLRAGTVFWTPTLSF